MLAASLVHKPKAALRTNMCVQWRANILQWRGPRGIWHMLAHSLCDAWPKCPAVGGHAASLDGHTWHYSGGATYTTTVEFEGGQNVTFSRRERPEMMIDKDGNPTHLITGVVDSTDDSGTMNDRSWTLVQPVVHTRAD